MTEVYDPSMTKPELLEVCKKVGLKNCSKLKKQDIIDKLDEAGVKKTQAEPVKKVSAKGKKKVQDDSTSSAKPRVDSLSQKLAKYIDVNDFEEEIKKLTPESTEEDALVIVQKEVDEFINNDDLTYEDYRKYIDKHSPGPIEVQKSIADANKKLNIKDLSIEEIYKKLAVFYYKTDMAVKSALLKKILKRSVTLNKPKKVAEPKAKSSKKTTKSKKEPEEEEEEEEDDDDEKEPSDDEEST
jgi:hypothetical protein